MHSWHSVFGACAAFTDARTRFWRTRTCDRLRLRLRAANPRAHMVAIGTRRATELDDARRANTLLAYERARMRACADR